MSNVYASKAEVAALVKSINTAAKAFTDSAASHATRRELQNHAKKLVASLEGPNEEVWVRAYQVNAAVAIEIATNLGVWDKFKNSKTVSLAEIVESSGADEIMIVRIFRQLVAAGVLADVPGPGYGITTLGLPYLNDDQSNYHNFMLEDVIPTILAMPRTLRERGYKAPTKESGSPFSWTCGEGMWDWMASHPDRAVKMVSGMKAQSAGELSGNPYPYGAELAKLDIKDDEVAIVDIAGGQGHILEEIRQKNPGIRGRFISQDLASTFEAVPVPPPGVEYQVYDFFTPQPVRNAYLYHYRHIMHDWNDEQCRLILRQLVPVLRENAKSTLLLVDLVLPDENPTMQDAVRDISMFCVGGMERTVKQWEGMLAPEGLRIKKIWSGGGAEACIESAIECALI